ncbi:MAG: MAPEG family protein [Myxococcota bacterium]
MSFPAITAIYGAILALFFLALTTRVILHRRRARVGIGDGEDKKLRNAIRVHGNFSEYVPFTLILLALVELRGASPNFLHGCGGALLIGRVLHAYGLGRYAGTSWPRALGSLLP